MESIKERVRRGYSRSWVVKKYTVIGLWPSEETLCRAHWSPGSRILDIGCGAGRTTLPLAQLGYRVTGIDISSPMVRQARSLDYLRGLNATWGTGDATDLSFLDNSFDGLLFSYNGIELVPGIEGKTQVLREAWRVLKPGGHLIFTTHALEALNRYAPFRLRQLFRFCIARLLRQPIQEMEVGEVLYDPEQNLEVYYLQVISPRTFRKILSQIGFDLVYYNSRRLVGQHPPPRWFADFDPDFKFYVARKPLQ
jgi:ubiquinone/menaquinone biosynthesis C-methylase UbiE